MRKKKEYPRKRKRFIRKIVFLTSGALVVLLVIIGFGFYYVAVKLHKPLYVSPLPHTLSAQADQGSKLEETLQNGLKSAQIDYVSINRGNGSFVVILQNGGKVTFSSQKDIMAQIASLQYILSHLTMEGRQFSILDLRFDKPVIVIKG